MFGLSLEKITLAIQGNLTYAGGCADFTEACVDPHKVKEGTLFFLLEDEWPNKKREVLCEVGRRGPGLGVVTAFPANELKKIGFSCPIINVKNPLKALQQLAVAQRNLFKGTVIVLTGSDGKKGTKESLLALLQKKGPVLCYEETTDPDCSLPLKILQLQPEDWAVLVVMGEHELRNSDFYYRLCQPSYGVITEFFDETQASLIAHLPAKGTLALSVTAQKALRPWLSNARSSLLWF